MEIAYQVDNRGVLQTKCPNGKRCLVGGGECYQCEHFHSKNYTGKTIRCNFRRKGTKNGKS